MMGCCICAIVVMLYMYNLLTYFHSFVCCYGGEVKTLVHFAMLFLLVYV